MLVLRGVAIAAQVATILATWPLWSPRRSPPLLPLIEPLGAAPFGLLLLATLALAVVRPRAGGAAHVAVVVAAILADRTRVQPMVVSAALLLMASLPVRGVRVVGRAHLIALWGYAGLWKTVSSGFHTVTSPILVLALWPSAPDAVLSRAWVLPAALEISAGVLCLLPWTRRVGVVAAVALHAVIFLDVTLGLGANASIWGWQVMLAVAAIVLFWWWREAPWTSLRRAPAAASAAACALGVAPLLWLVGAWPSSLAHHLYSGLSPGGHVCDPVGECQPLGTEVFPEVGVLLPADRGVLEQYFESLCADGDWLVLHDSRPWFKARAEEIVASRCARP